MFTARRIKTERPFKELYRVYLQEREDAAAVEAEEGGKRARLSAWRVLCGSNVELPDSPQAPKPMEGGGKRRAPSKARDGGDTELETGAGAARTQQRRVPSTPWSPAGE